MLSEKRGARVHQSNVSQWANGRQDPSDAIVAAIEAATGGAVGRTEWPCWRKRNDDNSPGFPRAGATHPLSLLTAKG